MRSSPSSCRSSWRRRVTSAARWRSAGSCRRSRRSAGCRTPCPTLSKHTARSPSTRRSCADSAASPRTWRRSRRRRAPSHLKRLRAASPQKGSSSPCPTARNFCGIARSPWRRAAPCSSRASQARASRRSFARSRGFGRSRAAGRRSRKAGGGSSSRSGPICRSARWRAPSPIR